MMLCCEGNGDEKWENEDNKTRFVYIGLSTHLSSQDSHQAAAAAVAQHGAQESINYFSTPMNFKTLPDFYSWNIKWVLESNIFILL